MEIWILDGSGVGELTSTWIRRCKFSFNDDQIEAGKWQNNMPIWAVKPLVPGYRRRPPNILVGNTEAKILNCPMLHDDNLGYVARRLAVAISTYFPAGMPQMSTRRFLELLLVMGIHALLLQLPILDTSDASLASLGKFANRIYRRIAVCLESHNAAM